MPIKGDDLIAEMRVLRDRVVGVTDVVVVSADGLLIAAETDETDEAADPEVLAALTAASLGIARRSSLITGKGLLHHVVARFTDGYLVSQAVGEMALIAVVGDAGMDVKLLHVEAQGAAERIERLLTSVGGTDPDD